MPLTVQQRQTYLAHQRPLFIAPQLGAQLPASLVCQLVLDAMSMETIRQRLSRRPFEPFALRLSNGENCAARHPENLALGTHRLAIVCPENDHFVHISLVDILSIEPLQPT